MCLPKALSPSHITQPRCQLTVRLAMLSSNTVVGRVCPRNTTHSDTPTQFTCTHTHTHTHTHTPTQFTCTHTHTHTHKHTNTYTYTYNPQHTCLPYTASESHITHSWQQRARPRASSPREAFASRLALRAHTRQHSQQDLSRPFFPRDGARSEGRPTPTASVRRVSRSSLLVSHMYVPGVCTMYMVYTCVACTLYTQLVNDNVVGPTWHDTHLRNGRRPQCSNVLLPL